MPDLGHVELELTLDYTSRLSCEFFHLSVFLLSASGLLSIHSTFSPILPGSPMYLVRDINFPISTASQLK